MEYWDDRPIARMVQNGRRVPDRRPRIPTVEPGIGPREDLLHTRRQPTEGLAQMIRDLFGRSRSLLRSPPAMYSRVSPERPRSADSSSCPENDCPGRAQSVPGIKSGENKSAVLGFTGLLLCAILCVTADGDATKKGRDSAADSRRVPAIRLPSHTQNVARR